MIINVILRVSVRLHRIGQLLIYFIASRAVRLAKSPAERKYQVDLAKHAIASLADQKPKQTLEFSSDE